MDDNFDKFLPDWQIGTLTLTANSTAFTASDALLTFGSIQQGDFIISPDGRMLIIESITDDSNGILSSPCPPEAAGTFPTRIRYQSDNSRYTGQAAALRRLMSGGNLFALAKLTGDPEMIVRFLGNGAFDLVDPAELGIQDPNGTLAKFAALTLVANKLLNTDTNGDILLSDITPFARTVLDDASGSAMFTTMGASQLRAINSGYEILPNGIIRQWGRVTSLNADGGATITYPLTFPNAALHFKSQILTAWVGSAYAPVVYADWTWNNASRSIWCRQINTSGGTTAVTPLTTANVMWEAIGW